MKRHTIHFYADDAGAKMEPWGCFVGDLESGMVDGVQDWMGLGVAFVRRV